MLNQNLPLLTENEEKELGLRIKLGDKEAIDELVNRNIALVNDITIKLLNKFNESLKDDMAQQGYIALYEAAKKYDVSKECKFSSFAYPYVRGSILNFINTQKSLKVPMHKSVEISKFIKDYNNLVVKLNHEPNICEIAKALNLTEKKVEESLMYLKLFNVDSLDRIVQGGDDAGDKTVMDSQIVNEDFSNDLVNNCAIKSAFEKAFRVLNEQEKRVINLRYGLNNGGKILTLKEVSKIIGCSRQRVQQVETAAILKLRCNPNLLNVVDINEKEKMYIINSNRLTSTKQNKESVSKELDDFICSLPLPQKIRTRINNILYLNHIFSIQELKDEKCKLRGINPEVVTIVKEKALQWNAL